MWRYFNNYVYLKFWRHELFPRKSKYFVNFIQGGNYSYLITMIWTFYIVKNGLDQFLPIYDEVKIATKCKRSLRNEIIQLRADAPSAKWKCEQII